MVKRMHAGRAAQSGLYSAFLASEGFRGIRNPFEADYGGFHETFTEEYDLNQLVVGLGTVWETGRVGFKPYSSCGSSHTSIDAVFKLQAEHQFEADDIESIRVFTSTATKDHVGWPYVVDSVTTAQMNLAYAISCAVRYGRVFIDEFQPSRLKDPNLLRLTEKIEVVADPEIDKKGRDFRHAIRLEIHMKDGTSLTAFVDHAKGSDVYPLTESELQSKFEGLASRILPPERVHRIIEAVHGLQELDDASQLVEMLVLPEER